MLTFNNWTDQDGVAWSTPVFVLDVINISKAMGGASFTLNGYINADQVGHRVLGSKSYILTGDDYTAFMDTTLSSIPTGSTPRPVVTLEDAMRAQAYLYAVNKQDIMVSAAIPSVPAIPAVLDADNNVITPEVPEVPAVPAVMKSYFDGATAA